MTKAEIKTLRMNMVGGMNDYIINVIGDENILESWLMCGVPDEATEDDLEWFADDEKEFADLCKLFARLLERAVK